MKNKIKTAVVFTVLVTIAIHIINKIIYSISTMKSTFSSQDHYYYEWRFGKIHYTKKGSGSPLLIIHDLTVGSSTFESHKLLDELSKEHEVYTLDLLGYGLSDKPNMTYTSYLYIQLINDFIKNIICKKTDILATGDSSHLVVMCSHNDPEIINKLILINPQSLYRLNQIPSKQTKVLKFFIDLPIIGTFVYNLLTTQSHFKKSFYHDYFYNPGNVKGVYLKNYCESSHTSDYNSKYSFSSYVGRYTNTNILHALKELNNSILIIAGKEKEDIETIVENYVYYNSSIETVYIPNTKHLPQLEDKEDVLSHIFMFL